MSREGAGRTARELDSDDRAWAARALTPQRPAQRSQTRYARQRFSATHHPTFSQMSSVVVVRTTSSLLRLRSVRKSGRGAAGTAAAWSRRQARRAGVAVRRGELEDQSIAGGANASSVSGPFGGSARRLVQSCSWLLPLAESKGLEPNGKGGKGADQGDFYL